MYRSIFIDLDDTVWAFTENARDTFQDMYDKYHFDRYFRSFSHFYTLYSGKNEELWNEYGAGRITKDELNEQRFAYPLCKHSKKCTFYTLRFGCSFAAVNTIKPQLL